MGQIVWRPDGSRLCFCPGETGTQICVWKAKGMANPECVSVHIAGQKRMDEIAEEGEKKKKKSSNLIKRFLSKLQLWIECLQPVFRHIWPKYSKWKLRRVFAPFRWKGQNRAHCLDSNWSAWTQIFNVPCIQKSFPAAGRLRCTWFTVRPAGDQLCRPLTKMFTKLKSAANSGLRWCQTNSWMG